MCVASSAQGGADPPRPLRFSVDPNGIETILISHLHGDHFGGLPFFILDAQLYSRRAAPLTIAGPPGLGARLDQAMEVLFPGSSAVERRFRTEVIELTPGQPARVNHVTVAPHLVWWTTPAALRPWRSASRPTVRCWPTPAIASGPTLSLTPAVTPTS